MVGLGVGLLHLLTLTYVAHEVSRKSSLYGAIGIALAFTARSLIRVLWIVHRLIWGVRPSRSPSLWAALILVGIVTVLFGLADLVAWLGSQSIGLRLVGLLLTVVTSAGAWYLV